MKSNKIARICETCKTIFSLNPRLGLEWAKKTGRGRFCSKICYYKTRKGIRVSVLTEFNRTMIGPRSYKYKDGIWSYRKFRKDECEDCDSKENLDVHHLDHNRHNNKVENLKTLCHSCHIGKYHIRIAWNKGLKMKKYAKI